MKRVLFSFLIIIFIFSPFLKVYAYDGNNSIQSASFVPSKVIYDGIELNLSRDPLVGIIRKGEENVLHYMPVKGVLEQIGYIVSFDDTHNEVDIITPSSGNGGHIPSISSKSTFASGGIRAASYNDFKIIIDGVNLNLGRDKMISVLRGTEAHPTFFMPLRTVLEYMGYYVGWDNVQKAVIIASDNYFSRYGVSKAPEPQPPEEPPAEGELAEPETMDDQENATEPLPDINSSPEEPPAPVHLDEAVAKATQVLTDGIHDPASLILHRVRFTGELDRGFVIYFEFSSNNALGGTVRRIAEVGPSGSLIIVGETEVEGASDVTVLYTAVRVAFQNAYVYAEYGG